MEDDSENSYEVSVYHGTYAQGGTVYAKLFHSKVSDKIFLVDEATIFEAVKETTDHLRYCPNDEQATSELEVVKIALSEVQNEKLRLGQSLDSPPLSWLENLANDNDVYDNKLEWAYDVLCDAIEQRDKAKKRSAPILSLDPTPY